MGGVPGGVHVHARLAEGEHAGVEIRASERGGQVVIELWAQTPEDERRLRAAVSEVREAVLARGLEGVTVDVRAGGDEPQRRPRDGAPVPEPDDAPAGCTARARRGPCSGPGPTADGELIL